MWSLIGSKDSEKLPRWGWYRRYEPLIWIQKSLEVGFTWQAHHGLDSGGRCSVAYDATNLSDTNRCNIISGTWKKKTWVSYSSSLIG
jgi:hypothetical protein